MQVAILKSFTYGNSGGNGAGVVVLNQQISYDKKQEIANKVGLSETAFIFKQEENDYDVSFFTPVCEVDLCGHATIAAFYYLGKIGQIKGNNETKSFYQNTKAGRLKIEITFKGLNVYYVLMQQSEPRIYGELKEKKQIADSLNIDEKLIGLANYDIAPTIVSTGLKDILVPVSSREVLNSLEADFKMIEDISYKNDVVGYHVFTIDDNIIYARNFAPKVGINEECATGTSNGALGSLLYSKGFPNQMEVIQGESMNERSLIFVKVEYNNDVMDVYVGGKAFVEGFIIV
ncbi:MAG: PhzF family phenazine biosynthesis protein [Tissierellia bacterium]|jgi:PhzF family phenazine biosynthesis protein|nr:PhzF family phenazine biosynthesis protein [Tissierellia bacterium]MDD3226475.1 PhzF family phenazine biosynthesis protein [Tissierellia bacterium]MDD3750757.1 PhzF family phenazine biosynthesis protein [Tissierellia bacterium]MDD4046269.1 PhzF family phenazine biosynthesis protein [Tissierellia bacterium]MDD4678120.1 PhzF family phenazine biosynthesis protein [Tissierellia bacterium]